MGGSEWVLGRFWKRGSWVVGWVKFFGLLGIVGNCGGMAIGSVQ